MSEIRTITCDGFECDRQEGGEMVPERRWTTVTFDGHYQEPATVYHYCHDCESSVLKLSLSKDGLLPVGSVAVR